MLRKATGLAELKRMEGMTRPTFYAKAIAGLAAATCILCEECMLSEKGEPLMAHVDFRTSLQNAQTIELTVTGRTSGRLISLPIWFALDGDTLYLIPVKGSDTEWYKNVHKTPAIRLGTGGKTLSTSARLITDETQLDTVLEKFRDKYGRNVKSYYPRYDVAVEVPLEGGK
jgi:deazaflavin-dependent oxidoreductase (nitroreductase family)